MTSIKAFFFEIRALFPIFEKRQGRPPPPSPSSYAPAGCQIILRFLSVCSGFHA